MAWLLICSCWSVCCRTVETVVNCGTFPADCDCVILLKELLPSGLYVDTYQTDGLHRHGAAKVLTILSEHEWYHYFIYSLNWLCKSLSYILCCFGSTSNICIWSLQCGTWTDMLIEKLPYVNVFYVAWILKVMSRGYVVAKNPYRLS